MSSLVDDMCHRGDGWSIDADYFVVSVSGARIANLFVEEDD